MRPRRIQPKPAADPRGADPIAEGALESAQAEGALQWVTARLPGGVVREIDAHAKRMATTRSDAIRDCLGIGIEAIRSRDGIPAGRADELLAELRATGADDWEQAVADAERDLVEGAKAQPSSAH
jgi:hypothetical protein